MIQLYKFDDEPLPDDELGIDQVAHFLIKAVYDFFFLSSLLYKDDVIVFVN